MARPVPEPIFHTPLLGRPSGRTEGDIRRGQDDLGAHVARLRIGGCFRTSQGCSETPLALNHVCETNSHYGDPKGGIREITGVGRLVGREPLELTRTHARTTSEQSCLCRRGNIQTNNDQRHRRSERDP